MSDQAKQGVLSPFLRRRRMAAARPYARGRVLDFACGGGAFAAFCGEGYFGCDIDPDALAQARRDHPGRRFGTAPPEDERFDTIVALAFIEHVPDPAAYARDFASRLVPGGRVVLTTPHPLFRRAHELGAALGIFSRDASEEHERLLDRSDLAALATGAGLEMQRYRRFLLCANQLAVWRAPGG